MSSKIVRDLVEAQLKSYWKATPIHGEENEFEEPPALLEPWLTYGFSSSGEQKLSIGAPGSNCFEEIGTTHITVFVPSGTGSSLALQHAESIRTMMRGLSLGSGLTFTTIDPPDTSFPSRVQSSVGNWFGYTVACHYLYNYSA